MKNLPFLQQNHIETNARHGKADPTPFYCIDIEKQILSALDKIELTRNSLSRKNAAIEIKKLFVPALTFLSSKQLEIDDRYFLRGLAKLEFIGILLSEKRYEQESGKIVEACGILRSAYVAHISKIGAILDGNKVCSEFSQIESKSSVIDNIPYKRISSLFLAVALSGKNYFFNGLGGIEVEDLSYSASLAEHAKFVRDSYHKLQLVKQGLSKLAKDDPTNSIAYWRGILSLTPTGLSPIALDYKQSEHSPKSGLIGIASLSKDLANLVIVSEILRTHPSGVFKVLAATLVNITRTLIETIDSYCNQVGGTSLNKDMVLAKADDLKAYFHSHLMQELTNKYHEISHHPEYQPQAESIALGLNLPKVPKAA